MSESLLRGFYRDGEIIPFSIYRSQVISTGLKPGYPVKKYLIPFLETGPISFTLDIEVIKREVDSGSSLYPIQMPYINTIAIPIMEYVRID